MEYLIVMVALAVGSAVYQRSVQKKAQERGRDASLAAAEEQARAAGKAYGVAQAPISEKQMQKIMKQREIDSLVDEFVRQEQQAPRIHTLPTAQPSSPIVRANIAIHKFLTGAA